MRCQNKNKNVDHPLLMYMNANGWIFSIYFVCILLQKRGWNRGLITGGVALVLQVDWACEHFGLTHSRLDGFKLDKCQFFFPCLFNWTWSNLFCKQIQIIEDISISNSLKIVQNQKNNNRWRWFCFIVGRKQRHLLSYHCSKFPISK